MTGKVEITWEPNPQSAPTLRLKGRLDADGAQMLREEALEFLKKSEKPNLVVDLTALEFVASTGLAIILLLTEEFVDAQGALVLTNANATVMQVISLLNIDQFLNLADSEEQAMQWIGV